MSNNTGLLRGFTHQLSLVNKDGALNKLIDGKAGKAITTLTSSSYLLPVIMLETTVVAGRCHQAKKRGGWLELRERFIEEITTSLVWLGGVKALSAIFDKAIDIATKGKINTRVHFNKIDSIYLNEKIAQRVKALKAGKIILSSVLAIYTVGSIIPKFNQNLTKKILAKKSQDNNQKEINPEKGINKENNSVSGETGNTRNDVFTASLKDRPAYKNSRHDKLNSMQGYLNSTKNSKIPAFNGGLLFSNFVKLGNYIDTSDIGKILVVDTGVTGGRTAHARNNAERREIMFRDLVSIYFYTFSIGHIIKLLSSDKFNIFGKKLNFGLGLDKKMGLNTALTSDVVKHIHSNIVEQAEKNLSRTGSEFTAKGFHEHIKSNLFTDKFKEEIFNVARPDRDKPEEYVDQKDLNDIWEGVNRYVNSFTEKVSNKFKNNNGITLKDIEDLSLKMKNQNTLLKGAYFLAGFSVSALFLSVIIPKLQCLMTKITTGEDKFPGVQGLEDQIIAERQKNR